MRKLLSISLSLALSLTLLAGCGSKDKAASNNTTANAATTPAAAASSTNIVKVGMGHITSIASSKDLGTDKDGKDVLPVGQVDTVIVAAAFDKDGKVVNVTIDNAQTKVEFNKDLTLKSDVKAEQKTKVELKDAYGMIKASTIKKEWYQQAEALGNWMVGKTVADIKAMKTIKKDDAHPNVPDVPELKASVSITVQDYIAALEEAYKNAVEVKNAVKVGLGHNINIEKSKALGKDKDGKEVLPVAEVNTVINVTALDKDGKVVKSLLDTAQTKINFDNKGKVTSDKKAENKTKVELKEAYGMAKSSSIKKEWYQQAEALTKWMEGKTIAQIKGMKTVSKDGKVLADEAELKSSVTVGIADYLSAVEEASKNAK